MNLSELSLLEKIALNPNPEKLLDELAPTEEDKKHLFHSFYFKARPKQLPPNGDWITWLIKSGRGFGKTWIGSNMVIERAKRYKEPIAIIGKNAADVRDVQVELGDSSILKIAPPWFTPEYQPSKRRLVFPNGVVGILYSAEDPDLLRGPQHGFYWCDEFAKYQYPKELWENLMFGLRLGDNPQGVITTTPRPLKQLIEIANNPKTKTTTGSSYENRSNLADIFFTDILKTYEGTRLGRQEIYGEILTDVPGALWTYTNLDKNRIRKAPNLEQVVVAIDPAVTANEDSNLTGIVVVGKEGDRGYVLREQSGIYTPTEWAKVAVDLYNEFNADIVVAEVNQGGDLVESNLQMYCRSIEQPLLPYKAVRATRGKYIRAQPIAALYEQDRVHHVGNFADLEDELCNWLPGDASPNRLDALVWGFTYLFVKENVTEVSTASLW